MKRQMSYEKEGHIKKFHESSLRTCGKQQLKKIKCSSEISNPSTKFNRILWLHRYKLTLCANLSAGWWERI